MFTQINAPQLPNSSASDNTTTVDEAKLRQSAQDFEAAYIAQMLTFSGLDKALMAGGGQEVAAFTSFYIESFAEKIAEKGGFGLADKFYDRMLTLSNLSAENNDLNNNGKTHNVHFGKL